MYPHMGVTVILETSQHRWLFWTQAVVQSWLVPEGILSQVRGTRNPCHVRLIFRVIILSTLQEFVDSLVFHLLFDHVQDDVLLIKAQDALCVFEETVVPNFLGLLLQSFF